MKFLFTAVYAREELWSHLDNNSFLSTSCHQECILSTSERKNHFPCVQGLSERALQVLGSSKDKINSENSLSEESPSIDILLNVTPLILPHGHARHTNSFLTPIGSPVMRGMTRSSIPIG